MNKIQSNRKCSEVSGSYNYQFRPLIWTVQAQTEIRRPIRSTDRVIRFIWDFYKIEGILVKSVIRGR